MNKADLVKHAGNVALVAGASVVGYVLNALHGIDLSNLSNMDPEQLKALLAAVVVSLKALSISGGLKALTSIWDRLFNAAVQPVK